MANIELKPSRQREIPKEENETYEEFGEIESDCMPDDSDEDPSFDILEETRSKLSKISLEKSRPRKVKKIDPESEVGEESSGVEIPELDEKDGKCFEKVEELIKDGHLEKLKVDQCKVYLRKYGLRLTGNRGVLIERIREHLEVINGGGEKKYPAYSFVLNCKGDACMGDVVMFEQNVYEMFSIASRSATGPPCGTRIVTGRIVKESYGAAKQQHTFTIEVLWSRGEKPLPPLHPLLIKGRNLYRLKTMRQKWADEEERRKVLQEKHARGSLARCSRENRIQEKEMSKLGRMKRMTENKSNQHRVNPIQTKVVQQENIQHLQQLHHHQKEISQNLPKPQGLQISFDKPLISIQSDNNAQVSKPHCQFRANNDSSRALKPWNYEFQGLPRPHFHDNHHRYQPHRLSPYSLSYTEPLLSPPRQQNWVQQRQWCRLYRQGRCYYGDNCKYRHN